MVKMLVCSNVNKLVNIHLAFAIPVSKFNFCQTAVLICNKYNLFQLVWYGVECCISHSTILLFNKAYLPCP